ncbi:helicase-associated domain-containing protein [Paenibacillus montanisoli]|uniref:Helicase XPB/Ssl2 N-terminal domain-containing protein n=1 Tax=Paenibacillus montanisoli TaxID=2081970 RepID=A0A328UB08_9BACL|nr:helicase-associated domain-containing protein [Paenibacillus montanisoli]RAP78105.1 hypothetical protein DL346_06610 [Paenibacillus montanisoli]
MNLKDITTRLSDSHKDAFGNSPLWQACKNDGTWPDILWSRSGTQHAWQALSREAKYALETAVSAFGPMAFSEEQLLAAARPGVAGAELRVGLLQLMEAGILFAVRKGWGEKQFVLPADNYPIWYETMVTMQQKKDKAIVLVPEAVEAWEVVASEENGYTPPFSLQCVYVTAELLNSGMKRTTKGLLTKRTIQKCVDQLYVQSGHFAPLAKSEPAVPAAETGETYPLQLAIFLELAAIKGWLAELPHAYALREENWNSWLEQQPLHRETELLQHILSLYMDKSAAVAIGVAALCLLPPYSWFRLDDVENQLSLRQAHAAITKPVAPTLQAWCGLLRALGWMEIASDEQGQQVFRWLIPADITAQGTIEDDRQSAGLAQITPDGDIYVPGDCSCTTIWQLERLAVRKRTDHIAVYRLDRRSLKPDAAASISAMALTEFLEEASGERLPETVRAFIADEFGSITVTLQGSDPAVSLLPMPLLENASGDKASYELLTERLPLKALFTGIDEVPSMWLKQFRAYHSSTRRELMELALSWRTPVKLSCEGDVRPFVPERIVDADGRWSVVGHFQSEDGFSPAELKPDMWQEMMLVLPVDIGSI